MKKKVKLPKDISGEGEHNSCFHLCVMMDRLRFQADAGDVFYTRDIRLIRKMAKHMNQAADYFAQNKRWAK